MDLSGFDELTSHIENLSSAVRVFGSFECLAQESTGTGPSATVLRVPAPSIVLLGDKVILHNFQKPVEAVQKTRYIEYEDETGAANVAIPYRDGAHITNKKSSAAGGSGGDTALQQIGVGTVVFHIDNTSSMLRDKRMNLTKEVLSRVIPSFLRQGFRIVVNAWASTPDNNGQIQTREVTPDAALLEALLGVSDNSSTASTAGAAAWGVRDDSADASETTDVGAQLQKYLDEQVFDILVPKGRTDLYGSCFQLLQQCAALQASSISTTTTAGPVFAFVLTDGEHNKLDAPVHKPVVEEEDYFGVYTAKPAGTTHSCTGVQNTRHSSFPRYFLFCCSLNFINSLRFCIKCPLVRHFFNQARGS